VVGGILRFFRVFRSASSLNPLIISLKTQTYLTRLVRNSEYVEDDKMVKGDESKAELAKIVRLVLKNKGLKEVRWLQRQRPVFGKLEGLVEKVMKERKVKEGERVRVVAEEGQEREDVRCDYWNQMRAQGLL
jgi:hypothetical protein